MTASTKPLPSSPCGRGRPRASGLRERLLHAARQMVREHGVSASVERIAEAAGTTKVTLYNYFASKEALLQEALSQDFLCSFALDRVAFDPAHPDKVLTHLGRAYAEQVSDDVLMASIASLYRTAQDAPALVASVFESGPQRVVRALADYLASVPTLDVPAPEFAAEQFFAMVRGMEQTRALLGLPTRGAPARQRYLRSCVERFLKAYSR